MSEHQVEQERKIKSNQPPQSHCNDNEANASLFDSEETSERLLGKVSATFEPSIASPLQNENLGGASSSGNLSALGVIGEKHSSYTSSDVLKCTKLEQEQPNTSSVVKNNKSSNSKANQLSSMSAKTDDHNKIDFQDPCSKEDVSGASMSFSNAPRPESLAIQASASSDESSESEEEAGSKGYARGGMKKTHPITTHSQRMKKRDDFGGLSHSLPKGTITRKGDLIEFVASDLQEKIKQSSPLSQPDAASSGSRRSSIKSYASASSSTSFATSSGLSQSPSSACQQSPDDIPPIDAAAVIELEVHATRVADSLDLMMGNIRNNLHKMSAITIGCQEAYKRSVDITCDSVDASIKTMYALMAKCEELSASMGPVRQLAVQIKDIKRVLDLFESQLTDK